MTSRIAALGLMIVALAGPAVASEEGPLPSRQSWTFAGPFGHYDRAQIQRGLKVYREVCSSCHALSYVAFRNLAQPGGPEFSEAQAKAIAAEAKIVDGPNDKGEMFERAGRLSDRFPSPFPNEQASRAANNGAYPPDLSLMAKARGIAIGFPGFLTDMFTQYSEGGPDYMFALLTGYGEPPADVKMNAGMNYNKYFPGHQIAMPNILSDGLVTYTDGTPQTAQQYARDVIAFLMWTAEPHLEARKRIGFQVMLFLVVFAGLLYFTKKKVWRDAH